VPPNAKVGDSIWHVGRDHGFQLLMRREAFQVAVIGRVCLEGDTSWWNEYAVSITSQTKWDRRVLLTPTLLSVLAQ
jgi:hypothetical protein